MTGKAPFRWQIQAAAILEQDCRKTPGFLQAPCGSGKTSIFAVTFVDIVGPKPFFTRNLADRCSDLPVSPSTPEQTHHVFQVQPLYGRNRQKSRQR